MLPRLAAALTAACVLAALTALPAGAASVAFIDNNNLWLSSPDGAQRFQVTTNGTPDTAWRTPSQGPDGKTVAVFDKVLTLFGADGKQITANLLPVYSGALIPVYPIGLDMDWNSQAVAYGYSYCSSFPSVCGTIYRGYWLTFSDMQSLYPTNPQGQSDALFPSFYGKRVISSDSGGNLFVQPNVPEAPFTNSYEGWLDHPTAYLQHADVAQTGRMVAIEWSEDPNQGILVGQHQGTVPSDVTELCDLPVAAESDAPTFSPDGSLIAWADAEGVKVAGVPNLAAGTETCTLTAPVRVLSPTGKSPSFGGADVASILKPGPGSGPGPGPGAGPGPGPGGNLSLGLGGKATWRAFARSLALKVGVPDAGRVDASATVPRRVARRLGLLGGRSTAIPALAAGGGFAAAKAVVVARGRTTAKQAGTVTVKLRPTRAAKRVARRFRGVKLTIKVSQGAATAKRTVKLR
jgi:hypothetical protein